MKVERYLVEPQPYSEVTLRFIDRFIQPDGPDLPARFPISLTPSERTVFFLTRESGAAHAALEADTFTVTLGPATYGIIDIKHGQGRWESLEEFIPRIMLVAKEAGRTVGEPPLSTQ